MSIYNGNIIRVIDKRKPNIIRVWGGNIIRVIGVVESS